MYVCVCMCITTHVCKSRDSLKRLWVLEIKLRLGGKCLYPLASALKILFVLMGSSVSGY